MGLVQSADFLGVMSLSGGRERCLVRGFIRSRDRNRGFTLIELMVTLAVAAILLTVAVPSFQEFISSNRLTSEANGFMTFLNLARSEAIKSGAPVTLCVSTNGTSCAGSSGWELGYLIFRDNDRDGALGSGEVVVRVSAPLGNRITLRGSDSTIGQSITFMPSGVITNFTSGSRELVICDDRVKAFASDKAKARVILLRKLGSSRVMKGDDPSVTVSSCTPS